MAIFKTTNLTSTNSPTIDSVIPCVQNSVTKQISILQIKNYLNDGTLRELSSGVAVECAPNPITENGSVSFYAPGLMSMYAGANDPAGWLICNGRTLNAESSPIYGNLYTVIGTKYGGTSRASFNLPNLTGKTVFGLDDMGSSASGRNSVSGSTTLGGTAGSETHSLTDAETPLVNHDHGTQYSSFFRYTGRIHQGNNTTSDQTVGVYSVPSGGFRCYGLTVTINSSTLSIGGSHQNLHPYLNLNWIIKI
jgi:microcystin-dependent protein